MFEGKILAICLASLHVNSKKTRQSGKWGEHANVTATATVAFIVACDTFDCSLITFIYRNRGGIIVLLYGGLSFVFGKFHTIPPR